MAERITILGTGSMATVCAMILLDPGTGGAGGAGGAGGGGAGAASVRMWSARPDSIERLRVSRDQSRLLPGARLPEGAELTSDDAGCLADATMILSAIPTQYLRTAWQRLAPHLPPGVPIVSVTKGVENGTLLRPTQIIRQLVEAAPQAAPKPADLGPLAMMSGPNIAAELVRRLPAMAVVACPDDAVARRIQATFVRPYFRVYTSTDLVGVELAGATKNVIALAAGILDGLDSGNNAKAALVSRGLVEITRLGVAMGARAETFQGLAGLGDLLTTCVSPEGRNRRVGELIGRGKSLAEAQAAASTVAEGVATTRSVRELARRHGVEMPITEMLHEILFDGKCVRVALAELMSREHKPER